MRLSSLAAARPAYYDRNATSVADGYFADVGPHATTVRFTRTVAAGKKLVVEFANSSVLRTTVAAPVGTYVAYINVQSTTGLRLTDIFSRDNTLYFSTRQATPASVTIYAGEQYTGETYDLSTGGTITYLHQIKGTQYDA